MLRRCVCFVFQSSIMICMNFSFCFSVTIDSKLGNPSEELFLSNNKFWIIILGVYWYINANFTILGKTLYSSEQMATENARVIFHEVFSVSRLNLAKKTGNFCLIIPYKIAIQQIISTILLEQLQEIKSGFSIIKGKFRSGGKLYQQRGREALLIFRFTKN